MNKGDIIADRYVVENLLGEGGYGYVYLVQELHNKSIRALKISKGEGEKEQQRFEQEIEILKRLNHKNIMPIYDIFNYQNKFCYTMEYIPGNSFDYFTRKSVKISPRRIVQLIKDIAYSLGHAHKENIIHRDIKPANILYHEAEKKALITDFGLAKQVGGEQITATGQIVGSPYYLSPEQARGEEISVQSDIYSLGASLYHILAKQPAFDDDNRAVLIQKIGSKTLFPPTIREHNENLPITLEAICMKAMEKAPEKRYASMEEFAQDLERYLRNEKPLAPLASSRMLKKAKQFLKKEGLLMGMLGILLCSSSMSYIWREEVSSLEDTNNVIRREVQEYQNKIAVLASRQDNHHSSTVLGDNVLIDPRIVVSTIDELQKKIKQSKGNYNLQALRNDYNRQLIQLLSATEDKKKLLFSFHNPSYELQENIVRSYGRVIGNKLANKIAILKKLKETKDVHTITKGMLEIFKEKVDDDLDMLYSADMYMSVGDYFIEYGNILYEKMLSRYGNKMREQENRHQLFQDYMREELFPRIVDKSIFKGIKVSPNLQKLLILSAQEVKKWIADNTKIYWGLQIQADEFMKTSNSYSDKIVYNFLVYTWSKCAYQRAASNYERLLEKYPKSPLLFTKYSNAIAGANITRAKSNGYDRNRLFYRAKVYAEHHGMTVEEINELYKTLSVVGNRKYIKNIDKWLWDTSLEYLREPNSTSATLAVSMHQCLASFNSQKTIQKSANELYNIVFNYGDDKQKGALLYQSLWYYERQEKYKKITDIMKNKNVQKYYNDVVKNPTKEATYYLLYNSLGYIRTARELKNTQLIRRSLELAENVMAIELEKYNQFGLESEINHVLKYMQNTAVRIGDQELNRKINGYMGQ